MKIYVRGKGSVSLGKDDFEAKGGEGSIYHKGNIAYKIFINPDKMIPEAKIDELSMLTDTNIVKPLDILMDKNNKKVGFTTAWVDGIPLCKMFVGGFRKRENITDDHITELVTNMSNTIHHIHAKKCIMVDGNELNYIVGHDFVTPYFIDVNSWQTPSFPATAIMPTIKDYKAKNNSFNTGTDWYSFAVISCWLFVGIHPFRGKYPDIMDKDIVERTRKRAEANISIFNKDVKLAPNARLNSVPSHYKDWFLNVFHNDLRSPPPSAPGVIMTVPLTVQAISGTDNFNIKIVDTFNDDIIWYTKIEGIKTVKTTSEIISNKRKFYSSSSSLSIIYSDKNQKPLFLTVTNGYLSIKSPNTEVKGISPPKATEIFIVGNTAYYKYGNKLVELKVQDQRDKLLVFAKQNWNIMRNSKMYAGMIVQNMLGNFHVTFPIPNPVGKSACYTVAIPELNDFKIFDAKYSKHVMAVSGQVGNEYKTLVFRFNSSHTKYDVREIICDQIEEINFVVLDNNVAIMIPKDSYLEAFGNKPFASNIKSVNDPSITTDMKLAKDGTKALFFKGKKLYSISMK